MRTTFVLTVDDELSDFIGSRGTVDPSALVNQLIRQEMEARNYRPKPGEVEKISNDPVLVGLEEHLDENTHAG
jgi:hypothetical protein